MQLKIQNSPSYQPTADFFFSFLMIMRLINVQKGLQFKGTNFEEGFFNP